MKVSLPSITVLSIALLLAGCSKDNVVTKGPEAGPPKDGLKDLVKEDVIVGKPTPYNPKVKPLEGGDNVWVVYTGRFKDGRVFDSNDPKEKPDARPLTFQVGAGTMIQAFDKGLLGMYPGGSRKLSVPWKMGYGAQGSPKIPAYSDLYFDVKVLDYTKLGEETTYGAYDVTKGSGPAANQTSTCTIHTLVREVDGKVLDDTETMHGKKPVTFTMGKQQALRAIEDAVIGMRKGGVREVALPPAIAFQANAESGVSGTMLYYVRIKLIDLK